MLIDCDFAFSDRVIACMLSRDLKGVAFLSVVFPLLDLFLSELCSTIDKDVRDSEKDQGAVGVWVDEEHMEGSKVI